MVPHLGEFPLAIEVIPMARRFVAREIVKLGGDPTYRQGVVTDNGNLILDAYNLNLSSPNELENAINCIPGVVENGLFSHRVADLVLAAGPDGVAKLD